jgi:DNA-binding MltR family transcriptional regulator
MFKGNGELATLHKKIKRARTLKLIDTVALNDADLVRKIRNDFGHEREKLHFDSAKIVSSTSRLSTYENAETNQDAILKAVDKQRPKAL